MKYKVTICRIGYSFNTFEVEADDEWGAGEKAAELAADADWSNEKDALYETEEVLEVK